MTLPTSRIRTYTMGMPVIPDDLNEFQDMIIGAKHPLLTLDVSINGLVLAATGGAPVTFSHGAVTAYAADMIAASVPIGAVLAVTIPKGTRVVNVRLYLKDVNGQPALVTRVLVGNKANATTTISTVNSAATGATQTISHNAINYTPVAADGPILILLSTPTNTTGTYQLFAAEVDVDRL